MGKINQALIACGFSGPEAVKHAIKNSHGKVVSAPEGIVITHTTASAPSDSSVVYWLKNGAHELIKAGISISEAERKMGLTPTTMYQYLRKICSPAEYDEILKKNRKNQ